tara:strand:+ start:3571 stop:5649 length:2079 start_codon:yes stop_codon:yes gene_type:complete
MKRGKKTKKPTLLDHDEDQDKANAKPRRIRFFVSPPKKSTQFDQDNDQDKANAEPRLIRVFVSPPTQPIIDKQPDTSEVPMDVELTEKDMENYMINTFVDTILACAKEIHPFVYSALSNNIFNGTGRIVDKQNTKGSQWLSIYIALSHIMIDSPYFQNMLAGLVLVPFRDFIQPDPDYYNMYNENQWAIITADVDWYVWFATKFTSLCEIGDLAFMPGSELEQVRIVGGTQLKLVEHMTQLTDGLFEVPGDEINELYTQYTTTWSNMNNFVESTRSTLGRGAFGEVSEYVNKTTNESIAGKIQGAYNEKKGLRTTILREVSLIQDIFLKGTKDTDFKKHVISIHRQGGDEGRPLIFRFASPHRADADHAIFFMPLFDMSFEALLKSGKFRNQDYFNFTQQMCKAVSVIHNMGPFPIIHRDIKPANFLCEGNRGNVSSILLVLSDFGLARYTLGIHSKAEADEIAESSAGTPYYWAPEIADKLTSPGCLWKSFPESESLDPDTELKYGPFDRLKRHLASAETGDGAISVSPEELLALGIIDYDTGEYTSGILDLITENSYVQVGTKWYKPIQAQYLQSPKVDIFSLGIIILNSFFNVDVTYLISYPNTEDKWVPKSAPFTRLPFFVRKKSIEQQQMNSPNFVKLPITDTDYNTDVIPMANLFKKAVQMVAFDPSQRPSADEILETLGSIAYFR